jgi:DNA polymerase bacteriophage-type
MRLWLDTEVASDVPVEVGPHRFLENAELLTVAWARDDGPVELWDCVHSATPPGALCAALAEANEIWAHNVEFDFVVMRRFASRYGLIVPPLERWRCSQLRARAAGLAGALEQACQAFGLPGKLKEGQDLIKLFCVKRVRPDSAPDKWQRFLVYARQDVAAMRGMVARLPPLDGAEQRIWLTHVRVNQRGIRVDLPAVRGVEALADEFADRAATRCRAITGLGATQRDALRRWLHQHGLPLDNLQESSLADVTELPLQPEHRAVLRAWQLAARRGPHKAAGILAAICADGRVRDSFVMHGAVTGRWSSRGMVQLHNLPRPMVEQQDIDWLIELLCTDRICQLADLLEHWYPDPAAVLSSCVRGLLVPADGARLSVADFSKIELVLLFHCAGEHEALERLHGGADLYRELYATYIARPSCAPDAVNSAQRTIGKQSTLGCGYMLGVLKFSVRNSVSLDVAQRAVYGYRRAYPRVPQLWSALENAAIDTTRDGKTRQVSEWSDVTFSRDAHWLILQLPGGRKLRLFEPRLLPRTRPGTAGEQLVISGPPHGASLQGQRQTNGHFARALHGGALTEYLICGAARDMLAEAMVRLDDAGLHQVGHVHDEAIVEDPPDALAAMKTVMLAHPSWAAPFKVGIEADALTRYRKL